MGERQTLRKMRKEDEGMRTKFLVKKEELGETGKERVEEEKEGDKKKREVGRFVSEVLWRRV